MRRLAHALLLVFVFAVPWEQSFVVPGWGVGSRLIGLAVACAAGLAVLGHQGRVRRITLFHSLFALFLVLCVASALWSDYPGAAVTRARTYGQLGVMVWLIWEFSADVGAIRRVLGAYVLGTSVSVAGTLGALQRAGSVAGEARFAATGYNPNELGITLVLAIPVAWYLSLSTRDRVLSWGCRLLLPAIILAIVATGSRGAAITMCAAVLVIPLTFRRVKTTTVAAAGLLLMLIVHLGWDMIPQSTIARLGTAPEEIQTGRFGGRGEIWLAGLEVFLNNPVLGVGAGGFASAVAPILGSARSPHNSYLDLLVEQGIVGSLLLIAMMSYAWRRAQSLPGLERRAWMATLITLAVASLTISFAYHKQTWLILGTVVAHSRVARVGTALRANGSRRRARSQKGAVRPAAGNGLGLPRCMPGGGDLPERGG